MSNITLSRRFVLGAACGTAALARGTRTAQAQAYPSRPIQLVVGFPPGGSNDIVARIIAPKLGEILRTSVIIDNRPGANATIGTLYAARAEPDGYILTLGSASPLAISPHTYPNIPYDTLRDLSGINTIAMTPEVITINPAVNARTLREFIAIGRQRDLVLASSGNGGLPHLAIELFRSTSRARVMHVPYRGAGPAAVDVVGGQIDGVIVDLPALYPLIRDGKLRALAVTSEHRSPLLPDVPTSVEEGLPTLLAVNWFAMMAPSRTPRPIIDKLHAALTEIAGSAEIRRQFADLGIEAMTMPNPDAFNDFMRREIDRWGVIARGSGARVE